MSLAALIDIARYPDGSLPASEIDAMLDEIFPVLPQLFPHVRHIDVAMSQPYSPRHGTPNP